MIEYRDKITRKDLRKEPHKLFVFGDNAIRKGLGGQAKEMRGEPNAVGIPTKKYPSMREGSFFHDESFLDWNLLVQKDIQRLFMHVQQGGTVVWPSAGIGTGRAQLKEKAPKIFEQIERIRKYLE